MNRPMRIDAHQHFWKYSPAQYPWMNDQMQVLKRDYLPSDLKPLLDISVFDGTVAVQARQTVEETEWLLKLSDDHSLIKGVVGWVDLRSPNLPAQLEKYAKHPRFVGVRHVVQDEPNDNFMLQPEFRHGIAQLKQFDLTYDLLLFPKHLPVALKLVEEFPKQPFVLDHIAKPQIASGLISPWKEDIQRLARFPNVCCKLSAMVTEAKWKQWQPKDFHPYLDTVVEAFGTNRVMIGSDWPVCTLSGEYATVMGIVLDYVQQFPEHIRNDILGGNCARFYGLSSNARM